MIKIPAIKYKSEANARLVLVIPVNAPAAARANEATNKTTGTMIISTGIKKKSKPVRKVLIDWAKATRNTLFSPVNS